MNKTDLRYFTYVNILKEELVPAMGCTEPIALAYCSAKAREALGEMPSKISIKASGNIIKNVKSVIVPNTGGLKGLEAAATVGIVFGNPDKELQVISSVSKDQAVTVKDQLKNFDIAVEPLDSEYVLDMIVEVATEAHKASVRISGTHTNITEILYDGKPVDYFTPGTVVSEENTSLDYSLLTIDGIYDFANTADLDDVRAVLDRQINYNMAIAKAGLFEQYGASIGKTILLLNDDTRSRAKAYAAAASDARMGGCELPVVINSGSGNQGITTSIPVIIYAKQYEKTEEELYRALLMSNLTTLHLKSGIGRLSAYCGAVSAGVGAGAGITYLLTGDLDAIRHTIVNAVVITSGIVCDGAKPSCAAKISMAVEAGILGYEMYKAGNQFFAGDGLVGTDVENTIDNIAVLGHDGMAETDKKIIQIMTGCI